MVAQCRAFSSLCSFKAPSSEGSTTMGFQPHVISNGWIAALAFSILRADRTYCPKWQDRHKGSERVKCSDLWNVDVYIVNIKMWWSVGVQCASACFTWLEMTLRLREATLYYVPYLRDPARQVALFPLRSTIITAICIWKKRNTFFNYWNLLGLQSSQDVRC